MGIEGDGARARARARRGREERVGRFTNRPKGGMGVLADSATNRRLSTPTPPSQPKNLLDRDPSGPPRTIKLAEPRPSGSLPQARKRRHRGPRVALRRKNRRHRPLRAFPRRSKASVGDPEGRSSCVNPLGGDSWGCPQGSFWPSRRPGGVLRTESTSSRVSPRARLERARGLVRTPEGPIRRHRCRARGGRRFKAQSHNQSSARARSRSRGTSSSP